MPDRQPNIPPGDATPPADADAVRPPQPMRLNVTSDTANLARVRRAAEAYATAAGFGDAAVAEIGLVVNEAMANVIRHAYHNEPGRPIEFEAAPLALAPGAAAGEATHHTLALRLRLRDWGDGRDPEATRRRGYVPGQPGGLGLVCLKQMMDGVEYTPQPDGGMLLTMTKRRSAE